MKIKNLSGGQSLFELVVAIGIAALIIVVLVSLTGNALQNAAFAKNETLSGRFAQEAVEWLRGQRDTDTVAFFNTISSYPYGSYRCFNTLSWDAVGPCGVDEKISGMFVRQIKFESKDVLLDGEIKTIIEADITVAWSDSKGLHQMTNATDFSDWRQRGK